MGSPRRICVLLLMFALAVGWPVNAAAYSVLSHEAVIDSAWDTGIRPLLLKRFPRATAAELKEAHGYAYGGAIIQDLGYYPHGNRFFTDLTHYVRTGDFVEALLQDSRTLNQYAFALGALSHYVADNLGHRIAVNRSVPILYPKLERKYGHVVTYEEDPLAHIKTEFGFDVLEVAQSHYAPQSYHNFIGFGVSVSLLQQAFRETYGLDLRSVLTNEKQVLGSYRHDVSQLIPRATRIAWSLKKKQIKKDEPGMTGRRFIYNISRASYKKYWGNDYKGPSLLDKFLALVIRILPKIGPLKVLKFRTPTPATERLFEASFNATMARYRELLKEVGTGHLTLPNDNLDTDRIDGPGVYRLQDRAEAHLLDLLAKQNFADVSPALRAQLLGYFGRPNAPDTVKRKRKEWKRVQREVEELRLLKPSVAMSGIARSAQ